MKPMGNQKYRKQTNTSPSLSGQDGGFQAIEEHVAIHLPAVQGLCGFCCRFFSSSPRVGGISGSGPRFSCLGWSLVLLSAPSCEKGPSKVFREISVGSGIFAGDFNHLMKA